MNGPKINKLSDVMLRWEFKFVVTICLWLLAFTEYTKNSNLIHVLCLVGMTFSTLGDLFLMDYFGVPSHIFKGKQFYVGAASFAIAHIFYRQMFRVVTPERTIWGIASIITLVVMMAWFIFVYKTKFKKKSSLFWGAAGFYTGIILLNLSAAINCAIDVGGSYIWAMIGVISFVISDLFLFIREAKIDTPLIRKLVWVFYPLAQILIIINV